jgi:hypothetical protein
MFQQVIAIIRGSYLPQKLLQQYLYCGCIWITIRPVWSVVGCNQECTRHICSLFHNVYTYILLHAMKYCSQLFSLADLTNRMKFSYVGFDYILDIQIYYSTVANNPLLGASFPYVILLPVVNSCVCRVWTGFA